ncbi:MAG: hypothetical protein RIC35_17635 [Marinoscillum sp.]
MIYRTTLLFSLYVLASWSCQTRDSRVGEIPMDSTYFETGEIAGTVTDKRLIEASGLAHSVQNPGHFWTHNDSEGYPSVYLIDQKGQIRITVRLEGVVNVDWEDITIDHKYLYVGDIGDNRATRPVVYIYKFREPLLGQNDSITIGLEEWEQMKITYQNGSRDAETLMFDHQTGELIIVSKRDENGLIYSFPFSVGEQTIEPQAEIKLTQFTGGDISRSGEILLKNYDAIFYWSASDKSTISRMRNGPDCRLNYIQEPQGEAITFDRTGSFFTLSEHNTYTLQKLYIYKKK